MRFACAAIVAALSGLAAAVHAPVGNPDGNSIIKPGLNEQVPKGKPYEITWTPTTPTDDTITLYLLHGPSENVQRIATIVSGIKNTGSYTWNIDSAVKPEPTHYGLQLVVDKTGQYQYSTQFGISGKKDEGGSGTGGGHGHGGSGNGHVSEISDGQPQVPTVTPTPASSSLIPPSSANSTTTTTTTKTSSSAKTTSTSEAEKTSSTKIATKTPVAPTTTLVPSPTTTVAPKLTTSATASPSVAISTGGAAAVGRIAGEGATAFAAVLGAVAWFAL